MLTWRRSSCEKLTQHATCRCLHLRTFTGADVGSKMNRELSSIMSTLARLLSPVLARGVPRSHAKTRVARRERRLHEPIQKGGEVPRTSAKRKKLSSQTNDCLLPRRFGSPTKYHDAVQRKRMRRESGCTHLLRRCSSNSTNIQVLIGRRKECR